MFMNTQKTSKIFSQDIFLSEIYRSSYKQQKTEKKFRQAILPLVSVFIYIT